MANEPNGEAVANARVVIGKRAQEAKTGTRGDANFAQLATGKTQIEVSAEGFAPQTLKDVVLRSGPNQLEIKLQIAAVEDAVTVAQDKQEAKTDPRGDWTLVLPDRRYFDNTGEIPAAPVDKQLAVRIQYPTGPVTRVATVRPRCSGSTQ